MLIENNNVSDIWNSFVRETDTDSGTELRINLTTKMMKSCAGLHYNLVQHDFSLCADTSFYRVSICEGGLGSRNSVRPSVCPSVRLSHACIVTKLNDALQIFLYHTKGQSLCYSDTKSGWSAMPPSLWNLRSKWPTPSKNADFDRFPLITSQP